MKTIEDKVYYSVKEFAAAADISDKAVYQQLKTRLKEYSLEIDGITMINEKALDTFYRGGSSPQVKSSQVDLKLEESLERTERDKYISFLEQELRENKIQMSEKDKTIAEMRQEIIKLTETIANLSSESLQQIASITKNIQLLQAAEKRDDIINKNEIVETKKSLWDRIKGK